MSYHEISSSQTFVCSKTEKIAIIYGGNKQSPCEWYRNNKVACQDMLLEHGGVLLRGFDISSTSEFNRFANNFSSELMNYTYRSSPRTCVGGKIYTSTEYPADRSIPLHNENSYTNHWPQNIMFYCAIAATISGGETPLADCQRIYQQLDSSIIRKFEQHGVMYSRQYIPGIDLSWQEVFQTQNQDEVEHYCKENGIDFQWHQNKAELITRQIAQASLIHPVTKEKVWFNQAQLFHASAMPEHQRQFILDELGLDQMPRHCFYGNGSEIENSVLEEIRACYLANSFSFSWQASDLLLLDNVLIAHGRNPFQGDRKVLVAMC